MGILRRQWSGVSVSNSSCLYHCKLNYSLRASLLCSITASFPGDVNASMQFRELRVQSVVATPPVETATPLRGTPFGDVLKFREAVELRVLTIKLINLSKYSDNGSASIRQTPCTKSERCYKKRKQYRHAHTVFAFGLGGKRYLLLVFRWSGESNTYFLFAPWRRITSWSNSPLHVSMLGARDLCLQQCVELRPWSASFIEWVFERACCATGYCLIYSRAACKEQHVSFPRQPQRNRR